MLHQWASWDSESSCDLLKALSYQAGPSWDWDPELLSLGAGTGVVFTMCDLKASAGLAWTRKQLDEATWLCPSVTSSGLSSRGGALSPSTLPSAQS